MASQNPLPQPFYNKLTALRPMLFKVAKNMAISRVRHIEVRNRYLQAQQETVDNAQTESIESILVKQVTEELVHKAISQLPPVCKAVFIERKVNGLSHSQIASKLDIAKKTVESHISKGLKLCRAFILENENQQLKDKSDTKSDEC